MSARNEVESIAMLDAGCLEGDKHVTAVYVDADQYEMIMRADLPDASQKDREFKQAVYERAIALKAGDPTVEVRVFRFPSSNRKGCA